MMAESVSLFNLKLKHGGRLDSPLSSGRIVSRVTIVKDYSINPTEDHRQTNTWRLQLPLKNRCRLVLPYHAIQHATDGTYP